MTHYRLSICAIWVPCCRDHLQSTHMHMAGKKKKKRKKVDKFSKPLTPEWNCMQSDTCLGIGCVATTETTTA